ncbi:adenine phosphoribosyltransferase [Qipengyuania xiapuensis]|uniref:Adenine phosphoribosyltransferase n=1 Tax=Qipengyuania xiapuensis TaxID=2867236 RepID=A0ABX8ZY62_9SPHN|nr:adenine phosphoribosyltransferase [Qipengyuania xiapuensis]QZD93834.1 adenine phosphoribosyltransferase [Qipengyuania xiapuensis]
MTPQELKSLVRTIPDFPIEGIQFRDITTLIGNGEGFAATVEWLADRVSASGAQAIAGMEARGFIFGAAVSAKLALPFLPVRKSGKLPCDTIGVDYALEYGSDRLEMDPASVTEGQLVAMVDDLLATGGTACATAELLRKAGARVEHAFFVIDLPDLGGATRLKDCDVAVEALMEFEGD